MIFFALGHHHAEAEVAAMAEPIRFNRNLATAWLYDLLDHVKAQADTFAINVSRALEFAEASEKLWEIFLRNSWSRVDHMHDQ